MPDQEPGVAGGGEQRIVHGNAALSGALADLPGQQRPGDQAKPPVDQRQQHRAGRHDGDGARGRPRAVRQRVQEAPHRWARCQRVSRHQDQAHLHAEGEQVPEALAVAAAVEPGGEDAAGVKPHVSECQRERHHRQQHRQHERIGHEAARETGQGAAESLQHRTGSDARRTSSTPPGLVACVGKGSCKAYRHVFPRHRVGSAQFPGGI